MVRRLFVSVAAIGALVSATAKASFLPENNLHLQDSMKRPANVSEAQFNAAIVKARGIFEPIVRSLGGTLSIRGNWSDTTVNASATQLFGTWVVDMFGGLARRPETTPDGFAMVLCHEIGHHLAGFPF